MKNCFAHKGGAFHAACFNNIRRAIFTLTEGATHAACFGNIHRNAFTLAEVLITLGIIGVVAAMTMPAIIQKNQDKVTVAKLKKIYSILSQAYLFAEKDYGTPDLWGFGGRDGDAQNDEDTNYTAPNAKIIKEYLFAQIKNIKICDAGLKKSECGLAEHYYYLSGSLVPELDSQISSLSMIDGNGIMVLVNSGLCNEVRGTGKYLSNVCAWVFIDINGEKAPNTMGKDLFGFYLTKYGIIPCGTKNETTYSFKNTNGNGAAAWVIYNENLDYLRCPEKLDWDKKTSCK